MLHNTIWRPEQNWNRGIRVGTGTEGGTIRNNLVHGKIQFEGGQARLSRNVEGRLIGNFIAAETGDLRLVAAPKHVIDPVETPQDVREDIRGVGRGPRATVGAWEKE